MTTNIYSATTRPSDHGPVRPVLAPETGRWYGWSPITMTPET